jgi:hypothetical protein
MVWASKHSVAGFAGLGLKTWAEVSKMNVRHQGVSVKTKLSHERRGGRRTKITLCWTITPSGYVVRLKISKGKTGIV